MLYTFTIIYCLALLRRITLFPSGCIHVAYQQGAAIPEEVPNAETMVAKLAPLMNKNSKTAAQVSLYGGGHAIFQTDRYVSQYEPGSAPKHRPPCDRSAASPVKCGTHDVQPSFQSEHDLYVFPKEFRPLQEQRLHPPTTRFLAHVSLPAYNPF